MLFSAAILDFPAYTGENSVDDKAPSAAIEAVSDAFSEQLASFLLSTNKKIKNYFLPTAKTKADKQLEMLSRAQAVYLLLIFGDELFKNFLYISIINYFFPVNIYFYTFQ